MRKYADNGDKTSIRIIGKHPTGPNALQHIIISTIVPQTKATHTYSYIEKIQHITCSKIEFINKRSKKHTITYFNAALSNGSRRRSRRRSNGVDLVLEEAVPVSLVLGGELVGGDLVSGLGIAEGAVLLSLLLLLPNGCGFCRRGRRYGQDGDGGDQGEPHCLNVLLAGGWR